LQDEVFVSEKQVRNTRKYCLCKLYGGFHKWGIPKMDGLQVYNGKSIKIDDLEIPIISGNHH